MKCTVKNYLFDIFRCQTNIIIIAVVCTILAFAITLSNLTVLGVFLTNNTKCNAQVVYRVSLAISDLLVGILIFPAFVYNIFYYLNGGLKIKDQNNPTNSIFNEDNHNTTVDLILEDGHIVQFTLSYSYLGAIGFVTTLTILVSINTLTVAAIDRFVAVYRPLKYRILPTISFAKYASIII